MKLISDYQPVRVTILKKSDLEFSYFCGPGPGGQAKNKVASGVRIHHPESGAMAWASASRSQNENKRAAFEKLVKTPKMKFWLARKIYEVKAGEALEQTVERDMDPKNLKIEIRRDGKWVEANDELDFRP